MSQLDKYVKQNWQMDVNFKFPRLRKNFPKEWEEAVGYKEKDCGCGDCGCKN